MQTAHQLFVELNMELPSRIRGCDSNTKGSRHKGETAVFIAIGLDES